MISSSGKTEFYVATTVLLYKIIIVDSSMYYKWNFPFAIQLELRLSSHRLCRVHAVECVVLAGPTGIPVVYYSVLFLHFDMVLILI